MQHQYRNLDDDDLCRHARLVIATVMAKIHTIDWTINILKMDTLHDGMHANWYTRFIASYRYFMSMLNSTLKVRQLLIGTFKFIGN